MNSISEILSSYTVVSLDKAVELERASIDIPCELYYNVITGKLTLKKSPKKPLNYIKAPTIQDLLYFIQEEFEFSCNYFSSYQFELKLSWGLSNDDENKNSVSRISSSLVPNVLAELILKAKSKQKENYNTYLKKKIGMNLPSNSN